MTLVIIAPAAEDVVQRACQRLRATRVRPAGESRLVLLRLRFMSLAMPAMQRVQQAQQKRAEDDPNARDRVLPSELHEAK